MTGPVADLPPLHVGDHVLDRDDDDAATLVVTGLPLQRAATYDVDIGDADDDVTIATLNPEYPTEDLVIEAVYPDRTDVSLDEQQTYAFPRARLRLETPVHDRDDEEEEGDETVAIPAWAAVEARNELDQLIEETEGDEPDPLTDRTFRARDAFEDALEGDR